MKLRFVILLFIVTTKCFASDTAKLVVLFDFNKHELKTSSKNQIDSFLNKHFTKYKIATSIDIAGHTDQIGNIIYNKKLSNERATTVLNYIKSKVDFSNIKNININSFGKSKLLTTAIVENAKYINRRVEIVMVYDNSYVEKIDTTPQKKEPEIVITPPTEKPYKPKKVKDIIADTSVKIGSSIVLPYILFVGGEHIFLQISYPYLDELLAALKDNNDLEIEIQGHICCAAGKEDGVDFSTGKSNLSVARAEAVYNFFVNNGIDKNRLSYKGFGHQFPLTQERTEAERQRNRRVEIKIINK